MEFILEHDEVEALLREALNARGTPIPTTLDMKFRTNHKTDTIRVVFADRPDNRGRRTRDAV